MRERELEKQLIDEVKKRGGLCEKWMSGTVGWPDRIIILPDGKVVYVLDDPIQIGGILDGIQTT